MTVTTDEDRDPFVLMTEPADGRVTLTLVVPETLFWFRGHFPTYPILPGVVQLDWAIRYARQAFGFDAATIDTMRMKFRKPVPPGARLCLGLAQLSVQNSVAFEYSDGEGVYSSGQFRFTTP
jgi:3-hydroxymyristoyl/3-hydroxydecanoyl-(acyl carrier protein) dehydratase